MNLVKKNGYMKLPTVDPDDTQDLFHDRKRNGPDSLDLKPGLFVMFSKERRNLPSESEEIEMAEMKKKKPKHRKLKSPKSPKSPNTKKTRQEIIEEPLLSGDTIQRVSIRYACPVAELRRINKLYNDTDIHALKTIKIPVKEHSLLTEAGEREKRRVLVGEDVNKSGTQSSGGNSTDDRLFGGPETYYNSELSDDADDEEDEESDTVPEYRDISIQSALRWKHTGQALLEKLDQNLEKVKNSNDNYQSSVREVRLTFETPSIHPVTVQEYTKSLFDIPDWRILLVTGIGIIIFIAIGAAFMCIKGYCPFSTH